MPLINQDSQPLSGSILGACARLPRVRASAWKSWRLGHCTYLVILVPSRLRWTLAARVA